MRWLVLVWVLVACGGSGETIPGEDAGDGGQQGEGGSGAPGRGVRTIDPRGLPEGGTADDGGLPKEAGADSSSPPGTEDGGVSQTDAGMGGTGADGALDAAPVIDSGPPLPASEYPHLCDICSPTDPCPQGYDCSSFFGACAPTAVCPLDWMWGTSQQFCVPPDQTFSEYCSGASG